MVQVEKYKTYCQVPQSARADLGGPSLEGAELSVVPVEHLEEHLEVVLDLQVARLLHEGRVRQGLHQAQQARGQHLVQDVLVLGRGQVAQRRQTHAGDLASGRGRHVVHQHRHGSGR